MHVDKLDVVVDAVFRERIQPVTRGADLLSARSRTASSGRSLLWARRHESLTGAALVGGLSVLADL
jgi:hypothetical protein